MRSAGRWRRRTWVAGGTALAALLAFALLGVGCSSLPPLPESEPWSCEGGAEPADLWHCIDAAGPIPPKTEGAFRSTSRVVRGDLDRKRADQRAATACESDPPNGFEDLRGVSVEGAPPLHGYRFAGSPDKPLVVVVHGLFDSRNSAYVRRTAEALAARDFGVLVPDMRWHGCLLKPAWLPTLGLAEGGDLVRWGRWAAQDGAGETNRPVGLLGFSLGALDVLHALGRPDPPRAGAVAVSPPAALEQVFDSFSGPIYWQDRGLLGLIDRSFRKLLTRRLEDQDIPVTEAGPFASMLAHLERRTGVPGPLALALSDPVPPIERASRPLLILAAEDDPLFGRLVVEELRRAAAENPAAYLLATPGGGHIGFPGSDPQWFIDVVERFFTESAEVRVASDSPAP